MQSFAPSLICVGSSKCFFLTQLDQLLEQSQAVSTFIQALCFSSTFDYFKYN